MPIEFTHRYRKEDLRANPDKLFVYGDNWARKGKIGQAAVCRDEPNGVGICTKRYPSMEQSSFLTDDDLSQNVAQNAAAWDRLEDHLSDGGIVVWPEDGIGTGFADLPEKSPANWDAIREMFELLVGKYGTVE